MLVVRHVVVGPFAENTYLAACSETGEALVIDPGGETERVIAMREPENFRVTRIILTHGHLDHVAGAADLKRSLGASLQIHQADRGWLDSLSVQAATFGFPFVGTPPVVDHFQEDGETFQVGKHQGRIIYTPGHTAGGCSVFFPEAKVLFTGDTLFAGSVGRTDLPGGDFTQLERSIRQKLFVLDDEVRFYPGHGERGFIGEERRENPFVGEQVV